MPMHVVSYEQIDGVTDNNAGDDFGWLGSNKQRAAAGSRNWGCSARVPPRAGEHPAHRPWALARWRTGGSGFRAAPLASASECALRASA